MAVWYILDFRIGISRISQIQTREQININKHASINLF